MTGKAGDSIIDPGGVMFQLPERFGGVCKTLGAVVIRGGDGLLVCRGGVPVATCTWREAAAMGDHDLARLAGLVIGDGGGGGVGGRQAAGPAGGKSPAMPRLQWEPDAPDCWHGCIGGYHLCSITAFFDDDGVACYEFMDITDYESDRAEFATLEAAKAEGDRRLAVAIRSAIGGA